MTKQEKQHLELIVYRMDEADKRVTDLHKEFKNKILRGENNRLSKRGKPAPRKRNWKKKQRKN